MRANVTYSDPTGRFDSQKDQIIKNIEAGLSMWDPYLSSSAEKIDISFRFVTGYGNRGGGNSTVSVDIGDVNGVRLLDQGAAFKMRTGLDANGNAPDIEVFFDADFFAQSYWVNPLNGTPVPGNRNDLVSVVAHELGHAFGYNGWINSNTYQLGPVISPFDNLIQVSEGKPYFHGSNAKSVYGGPVPLTAGNVFHLGNPDQYSRYAYPVKAGDPHILTESQIQGSLPPLRETAHGWHSGIHSAVP